MIVQKCKEVMHNAMNFEQHEDSRFKICHDNYDKTINENICFEDILKSKLNEIKLNRIKQKESNK